MMQQIQMQMQQLQGENQQYQAQISQLTGLLQDATARLQKGVGEQQRSADAIGGFAKQNSDRERNYKLDEENGELSAENETLRNQLGQTSQYLMDATQKLQNR